MTGGSVLYDGQDLLEDDAGRTRTRGRVSWRSSTPWSCPASGTGSSSRPRSTRSTSIKVTKRCRRGSSTGLYRAKVAEVGIDAELVKRSVNEGFSGGEKKRSEMLQLAILGPQARHTRRDRLRPRHRRAPGRRRGDQPQAGPGQVDRLGGRTITASLATSSRTSCTCWSTAPIAMSGGSELALTLEEKGYDWVREQALGAGV